MEWRARCRMLQRMDEFLGGVRGGVGRGDGRYLAMVGKELSGATDSGALGFWYVEPVAPIMLGGWSHVPGFFAMGCPAGAVARVLVD